MRSYWFRIGLGALAIFIVGMMVVGAARRGVTKVHEWSSREARPVLASDTPFEIDHRRLGTITSAEVATPGAEGLPWFNLAVRLDPGADRSVFERCALVLVEGGVRGGGPALGCRAREGAARLVEIGSVRFDDGGTVPVYGTGGMMSAVQSVPGAVTQAVSAAVRQRTVVELAADSAGAFLMIRDQAGRPLVHLQADSSGASFNVQDGQGRDVVRFRADSTGVKGTVRD